MGEEIHSTRFDPADYVRFTQSLARETQILTGMFADNGMSDSGFTWGFELEVWLLDHSFLPNPVNESLLAALANPDVVPELSRFNVELNTPAHAFDEQTFTGSMEHIKSLWRHCNDTAHGQDTNMVMIGTLPTVRDTDLSLANMSPMKRYDALNNAIIRARGGAPIQMNIRGEELLETTHADVMLEAAATSLQIHLKTPASLAHRYFNASAALAAPMVAAAANAPILFDRLLWAETRIPVFEQSLAGFVCPRGQRPRVTFGEDYLENSILECFEQNLDDFPVLLPMHFDEPATRMHHLRLHNGTVWRWQRPLIGWEPDGTPHVRVEFRPLSVGPTLIDTLANCALYLGLVHEWVTADLPLPTDFPTARRNFYRAAEFGLDAQLVKAGKSTTARAWMLEQLLPAAADGLARLGVASDEIRHYLGVVEHRVDSGQTGANWQRRAFLAHRRDAQALMAAYCEHQRSGVPVHEWSLPDGPLQ